MTASDQEIARIGAKLAPRVPAAAGWSPPVIADLIKRIEAKLETRRPTSFGG